MCLQSTNFPYTAQEKKDTNFPDIETKKRH